MRTHFKIIATWLPVSRTERAVFMRVVLTPLLLSCVLLTASCGGQQVPRANTATTVASEAAEAAGAASAFGPTAAEVEAAPALKLPAQSTGEGLAPQEPPAVLWSETPPCAESDCGTLMITQAGQPQRVNTGESSLAAAAQPAPLPLALSQEGRWTIDTGQPSPDGKWVAYTSIGIESGGPVFLQNQASGEWSNLIEAANQRLGSGMTLPLDFWWDVIGWFPDSQRLMVGPTDLSFVAIIELTSSTAKIIPFEGGGRGGRLFVNLAPDGQRFVFTGQNSEGQQTFNQYDLNSGEVSMLYAQPYEQGYISNPRVAPDGKTLAFVTQLGPMGTSASDSLMLLPMDGGEPKTLVEGSLWMAVPSWSPDGERLAFAMADGAAPALTAAEPADAQAPVQNVRGNVWVVTTGGAAEQVTFVDGLARSPVWSKDGQTLAFVTHDGQVGLANADQPGTIWQVAGPAEQSPELISAFFLP